MKKIYAKLKSINKQIVEAETEVKNLKEGSDLFYKAGEKANELRKLNHWLGELNESKVKVLLQIVECANVEIQNIKSHASAA